MPAASRAPSPRSAWRAARLSTLERRRQALLADLRDCQQEWLRCQDRLLALRQILMRVDNPLALRFYRDERTRFVGRQAHVEEAERGLIALYGDVMLDLANTYSDFY